MVNQVSPGISITEWDLSGYVPGASDSVAAFGGVFSWGPANDRILISDEKLLERVFGKPTDDNFETFLIAANYLAYSNSLWVTRAIDVSALNGVIGTANAAPIQIQNITDFRAKQDTIDDKVKFIARYPGKIGNSIKVSVCASTNAFNETIVLDNATLSMSLDFTPNSSQATLTFTDSAGTVDTTVPPTILSQLHIGDYITAYNEDAGSQNLKIESIDAVGTPGGDGKSLIFNIQFTNRYTLAVAASSTTIIRSWEYFQVFDRIPGTSTYTQERGGSGDELHLIVVDKLGLFSGTPGTILEKYTSLSRATSSKNESGGNNYYKDVINDGSSYVYVGSDIAGLISDVAPNLIPLTIGVYDGTANGGTDSANETAISISSLAKAYDTYISKDDVQIDFLIAGKSVGGTNGEGIANYIIDNVASVRQDCVVLISPQLTDVIGANFKEAQNVIELRKSINSTDRAFFTTGYKYQYDKWNNKNRWVADCGDIAGLMARTDSERARWWSPAGKNRGVLKNVIRLAWSPDLTQRNLIYKEDVNPVIQTSGGAILFGDKTLIGKPTSFNRINVRRLFDTLEKNISSYAEDLLFEFNTTYTRARFRNTVDPYLRGVMGGQGIEKYKIICDETNNTEQVLANNQFVGSIYVIPTKSINFIQLNFFAVDNSVNFEYITGEVSQST